jgi:hypothetical protein
MERLGGALVSTSANPAGEAARSGNDPTGTRGLWRPVAAGWREDSRLISVGLIVRRLLAGMRRMLGFGVMRASAPLRNRRGEPIRARAWLESARIEERYGYRQELSLNADVHEVGEPTGLIKLVLPYDGDEYFTRQAHRDVEKARRGGAGPDRAIVGFLALIDYERTSLEEPLDLQANYGSVPLQVRLPSLPGSGEADQLLTDGSACEISQKYRAETPKIVPVHIDIELDDPDTAASTDVAPRRRSGADGIFDIEARRAARVKEIEKTPERQLDFKPDLWLRMTVRLHLPRAQAGGVDAKVNKVFISWPTHTSLTSLELRSDGLAQLRYNPEQEHEGRKGGLEWSDVSMTLEGVERLAEDAHVSENSADESEDESEGDPKDESEDEIVTLSSGEMTLSIANPGELYKEDKLSGRVEVAVNRLLSGMDARLYDATGKQCPSQRPGLKLKSIVTTEFSLQLYDAFTRRTMSPYQWLYFDEVIPSTMRIDDIEMALRNRGFAVRTSRPVNPESCWITAERVHGPDRLRLAVYVRGERYRARRDRSVPGGMTYRTSVDSGELRLFVYGSLRAESNPVVREINALRRALRERFDRLPAGR